jgi:LIVCS family branched-chain amino acid:cation transporter
MGKNIWTVSFAVFAMFFGAGNMTLPLMLSQSWHSSWPSAFIGFCLSGVLVTFIGLIAAVMSRNTKEFFAPLGLTLGFIVQAVLICIEGPFGIVPRCLIVAHGGIHAVFPHIDAGVFYILSGVLLFFLASNKGMLVKIIGQYMTPILLSLLTIIISIIVYQNINSPIVASGKYNADAMVDGIYKGYLTYDLPGAIYFTTIAMTYLKSEGQSKAEMIRNGLKASAISSILLIIVYGVFFYIGSHYTEELKNVEATHILPTIVRISCGQILAGVFASVVFIACISTAIAAITIWTDFVYEIFKKFNVKYDIILVLSIIATIVVSNLQFEGLIKLLMPALTILYPILILLSLYNIFRKRKDLKRG